MGLNFLHSFIHLDFQYRFTCHNEATHWPFLSWFIRNLIRNKGTKIKLSADEIITKTVVAPVEPAPKRFRAVYKFNEGSSSAVRQSVKMSALM